MRRVVCLLAGFLLTPLAESVKWEFGQDSRQLVVVGVMSGRIQPMEKLKSISIPLAPCMEVKYVLVEVENPISTPAVSYNKNINTVTITYKLLQISNSRYDIMAKGRKSTQCTGGGGYPGGGGRYPGGGGGHQGGGGGYPGGGGGLQGGGGGYPGGQQPGAVAGPHGAGAGQQPGYAEYPSGVGHNYDGGQNYGGGGQNYGDESSEELD